MVAERALSWNQEMAIAKTETETEMAVELGANAFDQVRSVVMEANLVGPWCWRDRNGLSENA